MAVSALNAGVYGLDNGLWSATILDFAANYCNYSAPLVWSKRYSFFLFVEGDISLIVLAIDIKEANMDHLVFYFNR